MNTNKVILAGRLGKDPETKQVGENTVTNFSLATNRRWKNKEGEKQEATDWHNIVIWGGQAKVAQDYLKKGSECLVVGELRTRSYDDKDGIKRYVTEVFVTELSLGSRPVAPTEPSSEPENKGPVPSPVVNAQDDDMDLPF